ncbi:MAG: hypothetical protein MEQ07_01830 [Aquimonas sp.]|nr:hypothetical protein [Aquimonas sp.]
MSAAESAALNRSTHAATDDAIHRDPLALQHQTGAFPTMAALGRCGKARRNGSTNAQQEAAESDVSAMAATLASMTRRVRHGPRQAARIMGVNWAMVVQMAMRLIPFWCVQAWRMPK